MAKGPPHNHLNSNIPRPTIRRYSQAFPPRAKVYYLSVLCSSLSTISFRLVSADMLCRRSQYYFCTSPWRTVSRASELPSGESVHADGLGPRLAPNSSADEFTPPPAIFAPAATVPRTTQPPVGSRCKRVRSADRIYSATSCLRIHECGVHEISQRVVVRASGRQGPALQLRCVQSGTEIEDKRRNISLHSPPNICSSLTPIIFRI